jgi:glutamine amidotransferase/cyclase
VRSLANSIRKLGHDFAWVTSPSDLDQATVRVSKWARPLSPLPCLLTHSLQALLFPGVGAFGPALASLRASGYAEALAAYIASGRPYMGICIGMQALFEASDEAPGVAGLGVVPGRVARFDAAKGAKSVPQMGWNVARPLRSDAAHFGIPAAAAATGSQQQQQETHFYFVHSYRAAYEPALHHEWALTTTQYGDEVFLSSVRRHNVFATQFHPEKSGRAGLEVLRAWLEGGAAAAAQEEVRWLVDPQHAASPAAADGLTKRVVACLDVRSNDEGDLVVTKGESYDVREKAAGASSGGVGAVRNLGKPVALSQRYYAEGADEVVFLNITSFRSAALRDQPMLAVVENAAATVFVPLTVGGGIKASVDPDGTPHSAKEVADAYFRAGADKVSIGSEAVVAVLELLEAAGASVAGDPALAKDSALSGSTGIEQISKAYGAQAVVVSIDPKRVYVDASEVAAHPHARSIVEGAKGSRDEGRQWWYTATISGGRETRDLDVVQLARGVQRLGAGEILLNSIDQDGQGRGFDRLLIDLVRRSVGIPVVASSG